MDEDTARLLEQSDKICGCEHIDHEFHPLLTTKAPVKHRMFEVPAGKHRARYVGKVCDDCARTCMAQYLID